MVANHHHISSFLGEMYPTFIYVHCPHCLCFWAANPKSSEAIESATRDRDNHISKFHGERE